MPTTITADIAGLSTGALRLLDPKAMRWAAADALNTAAQTAKAELLRALPNIIDRPTPYTLRSVFTTTATERRLDVTVGFKDLPTREHYLMPLVRGGARQKKRSEQRLNRFVIPSDNLNLDQYGNVRSGTMTAVLSQLGAFQSDLDMNARGSKRSKRSRRQAAYFLKDDAIWRRKGKDIEPVFWLTTKAPTYRRILPFNQIVRGVAERVYEREIRLELDKRLRKAGIQ